MQKYKIIGRLSNGFFSLASNTLILNNIRIILGAICAEDYS